MTTASHTRRPVTRRLEALFFRDIPPHSYAALRMAFGALGVVSLLGMLPVSAFWALDGLSPASADGVGPRAALQAYGLGTAAGWAAFVFLAAAFGAMCIGYRSNVAVLACFVGSVAQSAWNHLPLSSAHQVVVVVLFCLVWADCGRVWSIDALLGFERHGATGTGVAVWPLLLLRCQIAVIYGFSGIWKLFSPVWRDGSAVFYTLNLNLFHRFPYATPEGLEPVLTLVTYATMAFELGFPVLVSLRRTRTAVLIGGVALHAGLWATLELGPFSWVMMASYLAFIDPERLPGLIARVLRRRETAAA